MNELMKAYFERDLSEFEEQQLQDALRKDPQLAEAMAEEARRRYLNYGLPDPLKSASNGTWRKALSWTLAVAASLTLVVLISRSWNQPESDPGPIVLTRGRGLLGGASTDEQLVVVLKNVPSDGLAMEGADPSARPASKVQFTVIAKRRGTWDIRVVSTHGELLHEHQITTDHAQELVYTWDRRDKKGRWVKGEEWQVLVVERH